jgi:hypothetical protein
MRRLLLIMLILILAAGGVWYFVVRPKQQNSNIEAGNGFRSFFSLGTSDDNAQLPEVTDITGNSMDITAADSTFKQVSVGPVAGYTAYTVTQTVTVPAPDPKQKPTTQTITNHYVRYVSRSNGYVYEAKDGGIATQITNIFIPNIYEAYFADNNQTAILRFLRDDGQTIATYSVPIPLPNPDGTRTQKAGTYFPDTIQSFAISPDQKTVARLISDSTNGIITTSDSKGAAVKEIVRSPFREWLISWANQPYAQTKASASANGFLYRIDTINKRLVRVVGSIPGLTASVSPKGSYALYSESTPDSFATRLYNTKTGSVKNFSSLILPEKCVWLANEDALCAGNENVAPATYPDDWYKGLVSFRDKLYRIYSNGALIDTLGGGEVYPYDMVQLSYSEPQNSLYFIDKNTGILWQHSL